MICGECDFISLYFMCCSVNGSVCLVCCVYAKFLRVVVILLLNVMNVFSMGRGALLDRPCMVFQRIWVLYL